MEKIDNLFCAIPCLLLFGCSHLSLRVWQLLPVLEVHAELWNTVHVRRKEKEAGQITKEGASEGYMTIPSLPKEVVLLGVCSPGCRMPGSRHAFTLVTPCLCVCLHLAVPDMHALSVCWFETYKPQLPVYRTSSHGTHDRGLL